MQPILIKTFLTYLKMYGKTISFKVQFNPINGLKMSENIMNTQNDVFLFFIFFSETSKRKVLTETGTFTFGKCNT